MAIREALLEAFMAFRFDKASEIFEFPSVKVPGAPGALKLGLDGVPALLAQCDGYSKNALFRSEALNAMVKPLCGKISKFSIPEDLRKVRGALVGTIVYALLPAGIHACCIGVKDFVPKFEASQNKIENQCAAVLNELGADFRSNTLPAAKEGNAVFEEEATRAKASMDQSFRATYKLHRGLSAGEYKQGLVNILLHSWKARFYQTAIEMRKFLREKGKWM